MTLACAGDHDDFVNAQAKCYLQLIFLRIHVSSIVSMTFTDLLYILLPALFSLPLRHARGLGVADIDTLGGLALTI
jgi:hypothetical protein